MSAAPASAAQRWRRVSAGGLVVGALLIYARFAVVEPIQNWAADDLAINYSAAMVLRTGGFMYDTAALRAIHEAHIGLTHGLYTVLFLTYNNTPSTALLFWPLTWLNFPTAQTVFVIVNNVLYLSGIGLTLYALRARTLEVVLSVMLCTLLFFYAVRQTFGLGQMNGVLVFLMATALALMLRRRDAASGVFITLAASLKISPILLLGFFVAQRRWQALLGTVIAGVVLLAVMLIFTGGDALGYFVTQVLPAVGRGSAAFPNQSLLGALYRFVVPLAEIRSSDAVGDYPIVRAVWLLISIGLATVTLYLTARARLDSRSRAAAAFSVFIVAGLLFGGLAWDHYMLWLSIPICALIVDWFRDRWLRPIGFWGIFILALFATSLPIPILETLYRAIGPWGSSIATWGLLALLGLMLWRLITLRRVNTLDHYET